MNKKLTLSQIKEGVEHYVGHRVRLQANKSRKRVVVREGVIEEIYPSIFVIKVDEANRNPRKMSFCYSDLLTHNIELFLCENDENIVYG
ncbi:Veg family protein [Alkalibacter mobilis]|uniref:Veg family protein n=1 Tax=Alkalibacter mobilis TaxID=2787712 RepID=UPI00189D4498|nr:Veg family protein [Alkalibacter mobilis]MBF7096689.1 Veg family protein [Alkalibacter mobilis]